MDETKRQLIIGTKDEVVQRLLLHAMREPREKALSAKEALELSYDAGRAVSPDEGVSVLNRLLEKQRLEFGRLRKVFEEIAFLAQSEVPKVADHPDPVAPDEGWVSVDTKLPPKGQVVLIWSGIIDTAWITDEDEEDYWLLERTEPQDERIIYKVCDGPVTYWHSLPAPPGSRPATSEKTIFCCAICGDSYEPCKHWIYDPRTQKLDDAKAAVSPPAPDRCPECGSEAKCLRSYPT